MDTPTPGIRTSEGAFTAILAACAPLLALLLKSDLTWRHVALFAVAGLVVGLFGAYRTLLKLRGVALLLALLLPSPARADEPPQLAPIVARVPLDAPAPQSPSISQVLACTVAGIPDAVGRCAVDPGKVAPIDSRAFWTTLGASVGANLTTIGAWLITHYLPPEPIR